MASKKEPRRLLSLVILVEPRNSSKSLVFPIVGVRLTSIDAMALDHDVITVRAETKMYARTMPH